MQCFTSPPTQYKLYGRRYVAEYCYFFAKHSLDSIFLEIVGRHALSCPGISDHKRSLVRVKLV